MKTHYAKKTVAYVHASRLDDPHFHVDVWSFWTQKDSNRCSVFNAYQVRLPQLGL